MVQGVRNGGKNAYDKVVAIVQKPKNPSVGIAAMRAMGASTDLALAGMLYRPTYNAVHI